MESKAMTTSILLILLLDVTFCASIGGSIEETPSPESLAASGKKAQRKQYSYGRARQLYQNTLSYFIDGKDNGTEIDSGQRTGDNARQVDDYFKNHHSVRKSKENDRTQSNPPSGSTSGCKESWSAWGPKTVLFGCGERHRNRSCNGKAQVERRTDCSNPTFDDQLMYFKKFFFKPLQQYRKQKSKKKGNSYEQPLDLLFLVDRSESMQRLEFSRVCSAIATLIKNMELNISPGNNQVAMVTFGTDSNVEFKFNDYTSILNVQNAIIGIPQHRSGSSQLEQALRYSADIFNSSKNFGAHKGSRRVMLIVTDGQSTHDPGAAAKKLKQKFDVEIFVVGFKVIDEKQMMAVSSHPKHHHVFYFETAQKVHRMVKQLKLKK